MLCGSDDLSSRMWDSPPRLSISSSSCVMDDWLRKSSMTHEIPVAKQLLFPHLSYRTHLKPRSNWVPAPTAARNLFPNLANHTHFHSTLLLTAHISSPAQIGNWLRRPRGTCSPIWLTTHNSTCIRGSGFFVSHLLKLAQDASRAAKLTFHG